MLLQGGGNIVNSGAASFLGAQIGGSYLGVEIVGGARTMIIARHVTSSDIPWQAVLALMQGGNVTNGSTTVTGAAISGGGTMSLHHRWNVGAG